MSKKKEKEAIDLIKEIAAATDGQVLTDVGIVPYWIDTGNFALNWAISGRFMGGGFPGGRIIEAFGPEASGKSLLGYCFLGAVQRMDGIAIHLDCERSSSADFAERCGHVDPTKLLTYYPITLKEVETKIIAVVKAIRKHYGPDKPIGICWDSIGVNPSTREWNETELPENPTKEQIKAAGGNERPGERARESNSILRKLNPFISENNATLYVINQTRSKIGVLMGNPETTSGGGEALKFYTSVRLRCGSPKEFVDKKTKMPLGVNMKVKNKKNRHFTPGLLVENIPLFFDNGINPLGGLKDVLLMAGRVTGSGTYTVHENWAGSDAITFKLAKTAPFDAEVLYRCPALVDAKSPDEVKAYLGEWQGAIAAMNDADEVASGKDLIDDNELGDD